ncbi:MAG: hypothetical protein SGJ18_00360 [Pseudomonadota bacterium]|nr:hypothetical protein [Pseudomonadota bacterium]
MNMLSNISQVEFPFEEISEVKRKLKEKEQKRIVLSQRDFDVLNFILEMKFASVDEVYRKFFKTIDSQGKEMGFHYAKKRLVQLAGSDFLKSTKAFSESKRLFFATRRALSALREIYPGHEFARPSGSIDSRTIVHDYLLLKLRLVLEEKGEVVHWLSDRTIKVQTGILSHLGEAYSPDAVITHRDGSKTALEFEIAVKAKSRYQEKIKRYVAWIREHRQDPSAFTRVHYVVMSPTTQRHLEHFSGIYSDLFKIELADGYLGEYGGVKC